MTSITTPNILIVDPEPGLRAEVCASLAGESYRCIGVGGTKDALAAAQRFEIDVALLDLAIPGEGMALARELRRQILDLAVVLVTGSRSFDSAVEAMRVGVLDYLLKPYTLPDLMESVGRAVDWRASAVLQRQGCAQLHSDLADRTARLARSFSETEVASSAALHALLTTFSKRHPDTHAHAKRVAEWSLCVAFEMGVEMPHLAHIERAALLHDIGKIAIPDDVMNKPGPLTTEETRVMRSHVQIGHDLAMTVPYLQPAASIVLATHERFDGTGYPRGLAGQSIPIGARIIAAVDAFDALTSRRVYHDPSSVDAANAELVRAAGSHFDPTVVAAWLRCADMRGPSAPSDVLTVESLQ